MKKLLLLPLITLTLFACSKDEDSCNEKICLNGGECSNGFCKCPEHFGGVDCSEQETPFRIKVTRIEITKFPSTRNNGESWDPSDGPDIYMAAFQYASREWTSEIQFENATATPVDFEISAPNPFEFKPDREYTIELYDRDEVSADGEDMGGVRFTPEANIPGFPEVMELKPAGGPVWLKLHVTYEFK